MMYASSDAYIHVYIFGALLHTFNPLRVHACKPKVPHACGQVARSFSGACFGRLIYVLPYSFTRHKLVAVRRVLSGHQNSRLHLGLWKSLHLSHEV